MQANILSPGTAAAISKESCHGIDGATLKRLSQDIFGVLHAAVLQLVFISSLPMIKFYDFTAGLFVRRLSTSLQIAVYMVACSA